MRHPSHIFRILLPGILLGTLCLKAYPQTAPPGPAPGPVHHRVGPAAGDARINELLNGLGPGDTVTFLPGTYKGPFVLTGVEGGFNRPVVIRGSGIDRTVIDGQAKPGTNLDRQAFRLEDCSRIVIEGFTIRNCWTDLVRAENSSWVTLAGCRLERGKRALFATGRGSHHFLVEDCTWEQDPRIFTHEEGFTWDEVHHGIHRHYNGSLFQGSGISGVFVLRDNEIRNTFNAFRLSMINTGEYDPLACTNGEVYRNVIFNTADNVLEPEVHVRNLHYYHNRMVNGHAFVSITEVAGGDVYIYGNTAVNLPGVSGGWTVFKISSRRTALTRPLWIYNNSWQVYFDMVGSPRNDWRNNHVRHFNNACYSERSDTFGIYRLGRDNRFDFDCSNVPFPRLLTGAGHERNGLVADPLFRDPYCGDFRLREGSPCIDRGTPLPERLLAFDGSAPDIGAYENGRRVEGMPFRYVEPDTAVPYREPPRITRSRRTGSTLQLWFSVPLEEEPARKARYAFRIGGQAAVRSGDQPGDRPGDQSGDRPGDRPGGRPGDQSGKHSPGAHAQELFPGEITHDGYCLTLTWPEKLPGPPHRDPYTLFIEGTLTGRNGMPLTTWASEVPLKIGALPRLHGKSANP